MGRRRRRGELAQKVRRRGFQVSTLIREKGRVRARVCVCVCMVKVNGKITLPWNRWIFPTNY